MYVAIFVISAPPKSGGKPEMVDRMRCFGGLDVDTAALILTWLEPIELLPLRAVSAAVADVVNTVANGHRLRWERLGLRWPPDARSGSAIGLMFLAYLCRCSQRLTANAESCILLAISRVPMTVQLASHPQMTINLPAIDILVPIHIWRPDLLGVIGKQVMVVEPGERRRLVPTPPVALLRVCPSDAPAKRVLEESCGTPEQGTAAELYALACSQLDLRQASLEGATGTSAVPSGVVHCGMVRRGTGQSPLYLITEEQARQSLQRAFSPEVLSRMWSQMPSNSTESKHGGALWLVLNWAAESGMEENLPLVCFQDQLAHLLRPKGLNPLPTAYHGG